MSTSLGRTPNLVFRVEGSIGFRVLGDLGLGLRGLGLVALQSSQGLRVFIVSASFLNFAWQRL